MKPYIQPSGLLERAALWLNLAPVPIVDAMFGMAGSRVVMAGQRLGIFAALAVQPQTATALAQHLSLAVAPLGTLLNSLECGGYVSRTGNVYSLARRARKWLDPASPHCVGAFLELNYLQWEWWSNLENVVRTGHGADIHAEPADSPQWQPYITAMFQLARLSAPEVARRLKLPHHPKLLLDLAGGHGLFAAEACRRHSGMFGVVVDLPSAVGWGQKQLGQTDMADRVTFLEGDILSAPLPSQADGALCFQIIHHFSSEQNIQLLKRVRAALKPGGTVAIMDYFEPEDSRRADAGALLALHFRLTSSASLYTRTDLREWLREAGFGPPKFSRLVTVPIEVLAQARAV